ncbi:MAG: alpha/beta hydrolase family protein [Kofleriaceae bacterium]
MSVGCQWMHVPDQERGLGISMLVMYPTAAPEQVVALGPFELGVARDAPPREGRYPLAIISHGSGGSPLTHRELARHLAARGFIVAVPEHPFDHRGDRSLADSVELLASRPRDVRVVVDWLFDHSPLAAHLAPRSYAIIGHSMGGYTALALAGGVPTSLPRQSADGRATRVEVVADPRVASLVLLAPATVWFRERGALDGVHAPILLIASTGDELAPGAYMGQIVADGVPDPAKLDYRLVEDAHHYAFLSPWPDAMKSPAIPPSQDPPGFDRRRFLDQIYAEIAGFLAAHA